MCLSKDVNDAFSYLCPKAKKFMLRNQKDVEKAKHKIEQRVKQLVNDCLELKCNCGHKVYNCTFVAQDDSNKDANTDKNGEIDMGNKDITIYELKEAKRDLENKLLVVTSNLIAEFYDQTGVGIDGIYPEFMHVNAIGRESHAVLININVGLDINSAVSDQNGEN